VLLFCAGVCVRRAWLRRTRFTLRTAEKRSTRTWRVVHARISLPHGYSLLTHARTCVRHQTELVTNALQYYLTMAELEKDESY
jgi:hypothetical protein